MSQTEFTLTGWKAVVAVIVAVAVGGYSLFMRNTTLDTQAKDVIRFLGRLGIRRQGHG